MKKAIILALFVLASITIIGSLNILAAMCTSWVTCFIPTITISSLIGCVGWILFELLTKSWEK